MSYTKAVLRTLFYQYLLLFVGISMGFIANAQWIGWKSHLVAKSAQNIFFPKEFNEDTCAKLKNWGAFKLWSFNGMPEKFKVIEDGLLAEEFYIAKFNYKDQNGNTVEKIDSVRIRWKTWEDYHTDPSMTTEEELKDYIENGTLNSHESDKALKLYQELRRRNAEKQLT